MVSKLSVFKGKASNNIKSSTVIIDYKRLLNENPESVATISCPGMGASTTIAGLIDIDSEFRFGAKAEYNNVLPTSKWLEDLQQYYNIGENAYNRPQVSLQSLRLSEQSFVGYNLENFQLTLTIPVLTPSDDPYEVVLTLIGYCIGYRAGEGKAGSGSMTILGKEVSKEFILYAPNCYHVQYSDELGGYRDEAKNAATVTVGSRYTFKDMLITNVSPELSNTVYSDGKVTNVRCSFSFKPWRNPNLSTIRSWFHRGPK